MLNKKTSLFLLSVVVVNAATSLPIANADTGTQQVVCTNATTAPQSTNGYTLKSQNGRHVPADGDNRVYGQGGGIIQVTQEYTWVTSGSLSTSITAEIDGILASSSVELGISVTLGSERMVGSGYSITVPEDVPTAYIEYGNWGYDITWSKGRMEAPCTWVEEKGGSGTVVTGNHSYIWGKA